MSKEANDIILKNVNLLSKLTEQEVKMMPATEAPLPSIEQVERIVNLVKDIIFPDYMGKRQSDESIRSYHIGECVVELNRRLIKQIAHGLQFCEDCEAIPKSNDCSIRMSRRCSTTILLLLISER